MGSLFWEDILTAAQLPTVDWLIKEFDRAKLEPSSGLETECISEMDRRTLKVCLATTISAGLRDNKRTALPLA